MSRVELSRVELSSFHFTSSFGSHDAISCHVGPARHREFVRRQDRHARERAAAVGTRPLRAICSKPVAAAAAATASHPMALALLGRGNTSVSCPPACHYWQASAAAAEAAVSNRSSEVSIISSSSCLADKRARGTFVSVWMAQRSPHWRPS